MIPSPSRGSRAARSARCSPPSPSSSASRWSAAPSSSPTRCRSPSTASSPRRTKDRRGHQRQGDRQGLHQRRAHDPCRAARQGPGPPRGRRRPAAGRRRRSPTPPTSSARDGKKAARESVGASSTPSTRSSARSSSSRAAWPKGPQQVVIDAGTAAKKHYALGDTIASRRTAPSSRTSHRHRQVRRVDSLGGASIAVLDLKTAQTMLTREGSYDTISIAAAKGVSPAELVQAVKPLVPASLAGQGRRRSRPRTTPRTQRGPEVRSAYFLLGFGGIALFVGAFVIFNTLSITVAQRSREFATLRTLGASRQQVMRSVVARGPRRRPARVGRSGSSLGLGIAKGMTPCSPPWASSCRSRHGHRLAHDHRRRCSWAR